MPEENEKKIVTADGSVEVKGDGSVTISGPAGSAVLTVDPSALVAGSISIPAGGLTIGPHTGVAGPPGVSGPPGPAPTFAGTSTAPLMWQSAEDAEEEAEKLLREQELVLLPQKKPKKVLVAFIDDDGEGATDPYWAAYLEPKDLDIFLGSDDNRDAAMVLRLGLVKKYEQ